MITVSGHSIQLMKPASPDYDFLFKVSSWIKASNSQIRLYANPGRVAASDLRPGSRLLDLLKLVDIWQPEKKAAEALAPYLGRDRIFWIYQVGSAPAKRILPACYRKLGWEADRLGTSGLGFWSFSDTGGTSAWDDFDGRRPDWAAAYESSNGPVSSRRWEGFKAGIGDFKQLKVCADLPGDDDGKHASQQCVAFRSALNSEFGSLSCR